MNAITNKIAKAKAELVLDHSFYGNLILRLDMEATDQIETMATDGRRLIYSENFVNELTHPELIGVLAHEINHVCLGHCWRIDDRDKTRWNIACDYAINDELLQCGFTLPDGCLQDDNYKGLSAEEIYATLPEQEQQSTGNSGAGGGDQDTDDQDGSTSGDNQQQGDDPGRCGGVMPTDSQADAKEAEQEWKSAMAQAVKTAKGNMPAGLKRNIDALLNPELPWSTLLRDFVEYSAKNDYNWNRPSRRYFSSGIILPSLLSEELPEVVLAIDTSGSVTNHELAEFAREVSGILEAYETTVHVIYCDADIQHTEEFTRADFPIKLNAKGGGGTDFRPVFDHVDEKALEPCCLIYFTDMYGTFPQKAPEYPTVWITKTERREAPFGKTLVYK